VAQLGSAFGWGPKGRWFKSSRPDQINAIGSSRQLATVVPKRAILQHILMAALDPSRRRPSSEFDVTALELVAGQ
jgi:hypothetical protein